MEAYGVAYGVWDMKASYAKVIRPLLYLPGTMFNRQAADLRLLLTNFCKDSDRSLITKT
jgi:hypothetical protein